MLSVAGKIYAGILVDRVHNVTEGLIFTLKQISEKARYKKM